MEGDVPNEILAGAIQLSKARTLKMSYKGMNKTEDAAALQNVLQTTSPGHSFRNITKSSNSCRAGIDILAYWAAAPQPLST